MLAFVIDLGPLRITDLLLAVLCGFLVGLERQVRGKPSGIRTSILVVMGACVFIRMALYFQPEEQGRVLGQIITGIGFLGAGMMFNKKGLVLGVTSAAIIWILASIGCLIGFGNYWAAITVSVTTVLVLVGITILEKIVARLKSGVHSDKEQLNDGDEEEG